MKLRYLRLFTTIVKRKFIKTVLESDDHTTISLLFNCIHPLQKKKSNRLRQYVTQARLTGRHPQWIQLASLSSFP
jgi:hypothetical protein